jgi:hypothetical protein
VDWNQDSQSEAPLVSPVSGATHKEEGNLCCTWSLGLHLPTRLQREGQRLVRCNDTANCRVEASLRFQIARRGVENLHRVLCLARATQKEKGRRGNSCSKPTTVYRRLNKSLLQLQKIILLRGASQSALISTSAPWCTVCNLLSPP